MAAYSKTLAQARESGVLQSVVNVGVNSPQFTNLLNEAMDALAIRGNWYDLEQRISFCLSSCIVAWPEFVGTILGVRFCGGLANMQNQWYSFVNNNFGQNWNTGFGGINGTGGGVNGGLEWLGRSGGTSQSNCVIEDAGTRPCYNEVSGTTGKIIQYSVVKPQDIGKTITLFGKKYGGQPLQEVQNGNWVNGVTLTAASPYVWSTDLVTVIDNIVREPTQGMAYLYEYDSSTGLLRDLASFQPNQTNPRYRCSRIKNTPYGKQDANGVCWTSIEALVKLKFIPVVQDNDFLMISNLRAIKFAFQAIIAERANQDSEAVAKWAQAINELGLELNDKQPLISVPVRMNFGRVLSSPI